ncbi:MAG: hypothetical protein SPL37_01950 [Prevotella sp.]|nr:hypothetical protein [Prevotella sp.]
MEQIYKYRSFSASIASGYKLFRANLRTILYKSWIEAVSFALLFGLTLVMTALELKAAFVCAALALLVSTVFWNGRLFQLIDGGTPKDKLWRAARAVVVGILFMLLPFIGIPLLNVMMEIMLEEHPKVGKALKTGFKHWGYLFLTLLMSGLIMMALSMVLAIPLYICIYGIISNHLGMLAGDPSGLPASFPVILFFVGMLTAFIFLFAQLWQTYAFAYAHGAILSREEYRAKEKEEEKAEDTAKENNTEN